jgi:acetyl esterase/lipase
MDSLIGHLPGAQTDPQPPIQVYPADPQARTGVGLIIFPGGGYGMLAEHEGRGYAEYFAAHGITSFVVTYRLGSAGFRHPAMIEDALAAIHTVRQAAEQWGINPARIGVIGSSAGGHLAAHSLVAYNRYRGAVSLRPDFGILCYPVIDVLGPHSHLGSRTNLLGSDPTEVQIDAVDILKHVSAQTPPTFLWHTVEDAAVPVENSLLLASALRAHGVPFELHIYERGRHGLGLGAEFTWAADALRWIAEQNR